MEYDCSALPAETRAAIAARQIVKAGSTALAMVDPAPVRSFVPPVPAPTPEPQPGQLVPVPSRRPPSQADKAVADARVRLVNTVMDLVPLHGIKKACTLFAAQLVTGAAGTELVAVARAANQRARGDMVSARTLERWIGQHRAHGWWGLLPVAVEVAPVPERLEQDVAAVLGLYHSRSPMFRKLTMAAKEVTRSMGKIDGRDFDSWEALYARARRALDKLGTSAEANVALIKARHTGSERDVKLPFKRRDWDGLAPLDVWIMDGHSFKAKVRHPDHEQFVIKDETDPLEVKAKEKGLNYVKLDGQVGIIGNGAGLVMSTLDVVAYAGEKHGGVKPANFLDIGGGANAQVMADGLDVIIHDPQVKSVFVNVFGGITACDEVANGIKGALEILGDEASKPLVVRLDGNNVEQGRAILDELNHPLVTQVPTMDGAADKAAELANI